MSQEEVTKCPNCKKECTEINFKPIKEEGWTYKKNQEGRWIGYRNNANGSTSINPYPQGGTMIICGECGLYTFYPRKEIEI